MATMNTPVELPAHRVSSSFSRPADIHDRNWIPVLNGSSSPRTDTFATHFDHPSQFPSRSSSRPGTPKEAVDPRRDRTRSGFPPTELDAGPIPLASALRQLPLPSRTTSAHPRQQSGGASSDGGRSLETDGHTFSTGAPSTVGTISLLDDQVYTIPGNSMPKDELAFPAIPSSTRTSTASVKRPAVPTSKYNRKPISNLSENVSAEILSPPASQPQTPLESPRLQSVSTASQSPRVPQQSTPALPQEPMPAVTTPKLSHAKSTASERKARALHSHPSIPSIREGISTPVAASLAAPSPHRHRKSTDSRKSSLYDSAPPSAAPQEPLPDLPSEARRPPTRERPQTRERQQTRDQSPLRQEHSPPQPPPEAHIPRAPSRLNTHNVGHKELADFMTTKNTVIFRRFDDVHVRLLLRLQDEISALEQELAELEESDRPDTDSQNVKIMGELRRLLAEYDHLFANWKLMQASKADEKLKSDLERWLQKPQDGSEHAISSTAKEDLEWLKSSDDLSSVRVGALPKKVSFSSVDETSDEKDTRGQKNPRQNNNSNGNGGGGGGGGGGFAALFGCAGKRK